MRILFMGTPQIAATILENIAPQHEICGVFCQTDKPVGRRAIITPPQVKLAAQQLGIPVFQPAKLRDGEALGIVKELAPELIVVVAYGKLLPKEILYEPKHGCVNVHVSMLPKYRGASPLQHALLCGENETGVSIIQMDEGLDTGDILAAKKLTITDADDVYSMYERAAAEGYKLLLEVIEDIKSGKAKRTAQDNTKETFAPPLTKEMGQFTFLDDARDIFNKVRALCRWPVAYFIYDGKRIKVHKAGISERTGVPGEVVATDPLTVAARGGAVELLSVTPEGKKNMPGKDFSAGKRLKTGDSVL